MKSYTAVILAALAAAANAVQFTNVAINPEPGKPFELTWSGAEGPVTILLKSGSSDNLKTIDTIASDVTGESFTVTLDAADLPSDTYAFEIVDKENPDKPNYSEQFTFQGDGTASSSSSASASASSTSSSSGSSTSSEASSSESSSASASESSTASESTATTASASRSGSASGTISTSTRPSRTSSAEDEEETVPDSGSPSNMSPLALIFVTAAAMLYFN